MFPCGVIWLTSSGRSDARTELASPDPIPAFDANCPSVSFPRMLSSWLAEIDFISDDVPSGGSSDIYATLLEGNWRFSKGHNLKATYEFLDPSDSASQDEQERYSVVWELSPMQLLQARVGLRRYNGVPEQPQTNRDEVFAELHFYF